MKWTKNDKAVVLFGIKRWLSMCKNDQKRRCPFFSKEDCKLICFHLFPKIRNSKKLFCHCPCEIYGVDKVKLRSERIRNSLENQLNGVMV